MTVRLATVDLGTNTVRLLVVEASGRAWRPLHQVQRVTRLGEGQASAGRLLPEPMRRTALTVAEYSRVARELGAARVRVVATSAVREATNRAEFVEQVEALAGERVEVVSGEDEARLTLAGVAAALPGGVDSFVLFDIGGGSSELVRLKRSHKTQGGPPLPQIAGWMSLPHGVVTLAERHGGFTVSREIYEAMVNEVAEMIAPFAREHGGVHGIHMLGTSGTVTTIAGVHLNLKRYDRSRVDGCWMSTQEISAVIERLLGMGYEDRVASPCIGAERADLVLAGCAILEAIRHAFPCPRLRVADRGLREGILVQMMREDGVWGSGSQVAAS